LSIPDFPAVYGGLLPPLDAASVARINETRVGTQAAPPITAGLILLQYVHRGWAVLIVVGLISVATGILRSGQLPGPVRLAAKVWIALVVTQFALGAWTIWSNKAADIATSHVFVGALTLMIGVLLSVILSAMLYSTRLQNVPTNFREEVARA
jgi:heme a synthase